jgi:hypothetical protein
MNYIYTRPQSTFFIACIKECYEMASSVLSFPSKSTHHLQFRTPYSRRRLTGCLNFKPFLFLLFFPFFIILLLFASFFVCCCYTIMHASKRGGAPMQFFPPYFTTSAQPHETLEAIFVSFEEFPFPSDIIVKTQSCYP